MRLRKRNSRLLFSFVDNPSKSFERPDSSALASAGVLSSAMPAKFPGKCSPVDGFEDSDRQH